MQASADWQEQDGERDGELQAAARQAETAAEDHQRVTGGDGQAAPAWVSLLRADGGDGGDVSECGGRGPASASIAPTSPRARDQKRLAKKQKALAKRLGKLRLEGVVLDRSSQKGAVVVSTLVPNSGRRAQHQQRTDYITSTVSPAMVSSATGAGEWIVETVVPNVCDRHLDWFWQQPRLVGMGRTMFPNIKEVTESAGAYLAAVEYMQDHEVPCFRPQAVKVVCVADGGTPRTASLFATYLPQEVHSIDPAMQVRFAHEDGVPAEFLPANKKGGVWAHACTIEEWVGRLPQPPPSLDFVCVVAVHSHVLLEDYVPQLRLHYANSRFILLAVPCCVEQRLCNPPGSPTSKGLHPSLHPAAEFNDMAIHSHDRTVRIWDLPAVSSLRAAGNGDAASGDLRLCATMRTHTDKAKKGNYKTVGGRHRLISDMYGQHH
jgi:hypothetical protein